ncbi:MAG: DUF2161 family putative PD-(D/E)XK-type phosphodiesterase [Clostridiales bacterium]|jgi:hypothetical protein|nr:DUF2161 family putative PD-(D/E)XK-type phosphodiesterase [Clostridiales bacterium]
MDNFKEEELYNPVKGFFEGRGYVVRGEVKRCDMALVKGDDLAIVELKKSFNMSLLYQAIDRQKIANMVYIAIPRKVFMARRGHILYILEKMGIGLITIAMDSPARLVEAHLLPNMAQGRNNRRTKQLLAEFNGRSFDANLGGGAGRKLMTAHRERNLHIACALERVGEARPVDLAEKYNCVEYAQRLLAVNIYGWYERVERGVYSLSQIGMDALSDPQYAEIVAYYRKVVEDCITAENQGS